MGRGNRTASDDKGPGAIKASPAVVAFLGAVLPEEASNCSPACNAAGNKFQLQLIRALRQAYESTPTVFSVRPIGVFPKSREIWIRPARLDLGDRIPCQMIPFLNIAFLKQLTIGLANLVFLAGWLWRQRGRRRYLLVYNVNPPMSLPALLATRLLGGKTIAVVPDFPHNLSFAFSGWRGLLQRIDVFLEAHCLTRFKGIIPITKYIAEDYAPRCPMLVIEGGVDETNLDRGAAAEKAPDSKRICLFSGTLNEINGLRLLLDAFRQIADPDYRLWVFGKGPLEPVVREEAAGDPRIIYWGFLPNAQVVRRQRSATVLLNARPSNTQIGRYTFPSKLLEYMLSGRPVITTALPGIPDEYLEFVDVLRDETAIGLAHLICAICSKPPGELDEQGRRGLDFVLQNKNWKVQGEKIKKFISAI